MDLSRLFLLYCVTQPLINANMTGWVSQQSREDSGWKVIRKEDFNDCVSDKRNWVENRAPQEFVLRPVMFTHFPVILLGKYSCNNTYNNWQLDGGWGNQEF